MQPTLVTPEAPRLIRAPREVLGALFEPQLWTPDVVAAYRDFGIVPIGGGATPTETVVFDICDFKVYPMLSDTAGASAGPSYGAAVDVPGISEFSGINPEIVTATLKGDCRVIAEQGKIESVSASFTYGKLSLPVLNALYTSTLTEGATQNQVRILGGAATKYFKAVGVITGVDAGVGDVHVVLYKATITGGTFIDQKSDAYGQPKVDIKGIGYDAGPDEAATPTGPQKALMVDFFINNPAQPIT